MYLPPSPRPPHPTKAMSPFTLNSQKTHSLLSPLQTHQNTIFTSTKYCRYRRPGLLCFVHFNRRTNFIPKTVVRSSMREDKAVDAKDAALLVSTCITRNLPPALTLQQGLDKIKDAVEELKAKPPCCSSGMYRIQVAVPPSTKAFRWFCCQPESSMVFPLFFFSKEMDNPTYKSLSLGITRGVFGIGSAVNLQGRFSHVPGKSTAFQRHLPVELTSSLAYGFLDVKFDTVLSSMQHETGSYYFFIPQLELDECNGISMLRATLAWDYSSICTFSEAVQNFELSYGQVRRCISEPMRHVLIKFDTVEESRVPMVTINALLPGGRVHEASTMELEDASLCSSQFLARLSPTLAIANNMHHRDCNQVCLFKQDFPNINALWASLLVEEFTRLGLTYFCIAPGSRSSPLSVAAASHPLTTCIACIDERSLAFHALGYARGSQKPAVVITSSGTAVSNLLPAVVEASQDFVPLLLLTADRPPELHDVGANQAINQVNHFGAFVRHFFSLPAPTDEVSARVVLTTIDSAVHKSTLSPRGPVHINCHFREPLANTPREWMRRCLEGLDFWMSNTQPFTSYIPLQQSMLCNNMYGHMSEVLQLIQGANRGLLLFGPIHTEDEIWAALLLAKHMSWPVVVDILSGLRLRKYLHCFDNKDILFIDQLDHLLLSDSIRDWMQVDVIIQIGSRITSNRVSQMLEHCYPFSYILVDDHPSRHDPSHIVTHRIQSTITQFCDCLIKNLAPRISNKWRDVLQGLDMMSTWETLFLISSENALTEPYAAWATLEALHCESALFLGNSMPIRDANMYGCNQARCMHSSALMLSSGLPCHWIQVGANRGASGIDGLISTAIGFAVGCGKRVLCVIGDVSFLHDTNGLAVLKKQVPRKPVLIVVINNHGGGIFSQLPVANVTERSILDQFFYTSHDVSIRDLCAAHAVKHVQVTAKNELRDALFKSQEDNVDCVIEVESCIDANATFHSNLRKFARQASGHAFSILSRLSVTDTFQGQVNYKIMKMEYSLYRVQLNAPPTSASPNTNSATFYREGFVMTLSLEDGSTGFGEVAPLESHKENLQEVEEQLQFLIHVIEGTTVDYVLPLLKGSISFWLWNSLGIPPGSILPSVRCGLEMALLSAIAAREGSYLFNILRPGREELSGSPTDIPICALIDSYGSPLDTAFLASALVEEGFTAIKIKVARRTDPTEDIAVIKEVRKKVGHRIIIRADANRKWTYSEAVQFAESVKDCCLQYIEEPVKDEDDMIKFCEETGLPVALDETINYSTSPLEVLKKFTLSGVAAVVIKPSIIGGFETADMAARWAQQHGKMSVVSAAYETGVGLSAYIQFAHYLDLQNADICKLTNRALELSTAHGLGTYRWFKEHLTVKPLNVSATASVVDAGRFLQQCQINPNVVVRTSAQELVKTYPITVDADGVSFSLNILEIGKSIDSLQDSVVVFLHGFLGKGEDWIPIMKALSSSVRCVAIDLPGHGGSKSLNISPGQSLSMDVVVNILSKVIHNITPGKVVLVGYSMGARISLYMALRCSNEVEGAAIISGSPGLTHPYARTLRRAKDDFRACSLISHGFNFFLDTWYSEEMWTSLKSHPHFPQIVANRSQHEDLYTLAKVLSDLSIGRQPSLWEDLKKCRLPLLLIVGEKDTKFKKIAQEMCTKMNNESGSSDRSPIIEIPNSGHAVHLENPLPVIAAVSRFVNQLKAS